MDNLKSNYDDVVEKNKEIYELKKHQAESDKKMEDLKKESNKKIEEMQKQIQELLKNKTHAFNQHLMQHKSRMAYLKDSAIQTGKYWS